MPTSEFHCEVHRDRGTDSVADRDRALADYLGSEHLVPGTVHSLHDLDMVGSTDFGFVALGQGKTVILMVAFTAQGVIIIER